MIVFDYINSWYWTPWRLTPHRSVKWSFYVSRYCWSCCEPVTRCYWKTLTRPTRNGFKIQSGAMYEYILLSRETCSEHAVRNKASILCVSFDQADVDAMKWLWCQIQCIPTAIIVMRLFNLHFICISLSIRTCENVKQNETSETSESRPSLKQSRNTEGWHITFSQINRLVSRTK